MASASKSKTRGGKSLRAIAIFKWTKGVLLVLVTIGAAHLFHKDVEAHVENWMNMLRIDPDNRYAAALLGRLNVVHTHELKQLSFLSGLYAALFFTEGTGLWFRKRWAEYFTLIVTGLFIPLEVYELCKTPTVLKVLLVLGNVAIVVFLFVIVRSKETT